MSAGETVTLRDARRDEIPLIFAMIADDDHGGNRETLNDPLPARYYDAYDAIARDPNNRILVAERGGEVVGTLQLTFITGISRSGATRAQIEAVRVARAHRGQGIGEAMFRAAIALARERGCTLVQLTSDKRRADAHTFYTRRGFTASHDGFKLTLD